MAVGISFSTSPHVAPCYKEGKLCERHSGVCKKECPEWADYVQAKAKEEEERKILYQFRSSVSFKPKPFGYKSAGKTHF